MNVVVLHQARALARLGHSVEIITRRSSPDAPASIDLAERLVLRFFDAGPAHPLPKGEHESVVADFSARLDEIGPVDVLHSHHWFSGMAALPVARRRGIPHLQSFHSIAADPTTPLSDGERPESPGRLAGEALLARESDAVVAISEAEARTVVDRLGGGRERVTVVPPGVDADLFHPWTGGHRGRGYVVAAARLQPLKGLDLAIEAVAHVPGDVRPTLVVAGEASADFDGYVDELRALAADSGVTDDVRFIGPQSRADLAALLRESRLVLVPSHSETYGLVALEASASGVPVVASASGGLTEAVLDGRTGLVLASRDPRDWGAAIAALLRDGERLADLGRAGRAHAESLSWDHSAAALVRCYRALSATAAP
ncbi:glycosyltransferase [Labedella endophytica]|uniref:Glycosyltransferase n=1 Tax=Labedella endophytica TaxID=1523160 RepID=A0A3S0VRI9_9MICO|nr:glycosyltransferase [Labedella endophytica]RUQ98047.1 glycosyltransferase [Labedella endophytica]